MKAKNLIGMTMLVFLSVISLQADIIPGRWGKFDGQPPGTWILVILNSGERMDGALKHS